MHDVGALLPFADASLGGVLAILVLQHLPHPTAFIAGGYEDELERKGATVVRDARWVRDGNVVTSQGVSAGIDMALWLIGEQHSPAHARAVQRWIQYDPAPPYAADV